MIGQNENKLSQGSSASLGASLAAFFSDIKLAHSVFALPFAGVGLLMADIGLPSGRQLVTLLLCMVFARSFAMGFNRFADYRLDAKNPRTAVRMIPQGRLSPRQGLLWTLLMGGGFLLATTGFLPHSPETLVLALPLLGVLALYSYMKRISWLCHWYLGFCLGLAPIAVSIALKGGSMRPEVVLVGLGVMLWTAGFDILYALQDREFDRQEGLKSVPARWGVGGALWASRLSFALMIVSLLGAGLFGQRGWPYFAGVSGVAGILAYEHWLVRDSRQQKNGCSPHIDRAFFNWNAWVSVGFFLMVLWDQWLR